MLRPLSLSQRELLEHAVSEFQGALRGDVAAVRYLQARGIDQASAVAFRLGVVPAEFPNFERFAGRIAIPNINAAGLVSGVKFRATGEGQEPKYDQPDGQVQGLFNLHALTWAADWVALTEGEMDAVSLGVLGVPAVGVPGVNAWKPHHPLILEEFRRVVLVRDADEAGGVLVGKLLKSTIDVVVVRPPSGLKDVNDALVAGEGERMKEIIEEASR